MSAARRGFSLLEALAVGVLLALCAAVVAASLRVGADRAIGERDGAWCVGTADRLARLEALRGAAVTLEAIGNELVVQREADSMTLHREALPARALVQIMVDGRDDGVVRYERSGRSPDYLVEIRSEEGGEQLVVSGTTGWIVVERESDR